MNHGTVVISYPTRNNANLVIEKLKKDGYPEENISLIVQHSDIVNKLTTETRGRFAPTIVTGIATGLLIGATLAFLINLGKLTITNLGGVGSLYIYLGSIIVCAVAGGLIGTFVSSFISKKDVEYYENLLKQGDYLVMVREINERNPRPIMSSVSHRDMVCRAKGGDYHEPIIDDTENEGNTK